MDPSIQYCEALSFRYHYISIISCFFYIWFAFLLFAKIRVFRWVDVCLLIFFAMIGVGSSWWHMSEHISGSIADALATLLFGVTMTWVVLARWSITPVWRLLFIGFVFLVALGIEYITAPDYFFVYVWLFGWLLGLLWPLMRVTHRATWIVAAALFFTGLLARVFDLALCPYVPFGVHFLWHFLAAYALYLLMAYLFETTGDERHGVV